MRAASHSKPTLSRKAGRATARTWRWLVQRDRQCIQWMSAAGAPHAIARVLSWCIKLLVLVLLLYTAVWIAVLLVALVFASWIAANAMRHPDDEQPQWKNGLLGFGLYDRDGFRIDPHDPDEPD
ncbi:DUF3742 family protein [Xanthomonas axonopodis pv. vasculorum]|uniref:DUF3742 family protein n=1 Tax=Xanthomonas axonopodis TaxID=53413 RepID=UPI000D4A747F|nr:DUF3742 family protein [Xanthomonas axonopodis]PPV05146.1 hypothetical protein XavaCFBP5823_21045 [Xanthomonas axonopodis pv. vasculorum]QKD86758.1 DUF3742 family protein [Xanthomonas axonopodis pv. vasculorum]